MYLRGLRKVSLVCYVSDSRKEMAIVKYCMNMSCSQDKQDKGNMNFKVCALTGECRDI